MHGRGRRAVPGAGRRGARRPLKGDSEILLSIRTATADRQNGRV
jgi:hypothetical protein